MTIRAMLARTLLILLTIAPALARPGLPVTQAQDNTPCTLSARGEVNAYRDPEKTIVDTTLEAGDGGQVMGQLKDGSYGVAVGLYYVESSAVESLRWVDYSADITLKGSCDHLPLIATTCVLSFSGPVNAYAQPDDSLPVAATFDSTDSARGIELVGQLTSGWYGTPDPAAPANIVGTLGLLWVKAGPSVASSCTETTTFYPPPKLQGDICTVRTSADGESYLLPDTSVTTGRTPLPTSTVQIVAAAAAEWYGYDPAAPMDGAVGVARLRWVHVTEPGVEMKGDCTSIPVISPQPTTYGADASHTTLKTRVGETLRITLPSDIRPGAGWAQTPSSGAINDASVLAQQGKPSYSGPAGGFGDVTFTFQAVSAGTMTLDLGYASKYGQPHESFDHRFIVDVTVEPAWILGG